MIYFDHNATAPLLPQAGRAWLEAAELYPGNPSSPHRLGARAEMALSAAREKLAKILGCDALDLIFTSGATEANNAVFHHCASTRPDSAVWVSAIEHPSIIRPAQQFFPRNVHWIPVLPVRTIDLDWVRDRLKTERPSLIVCMAANNETGILQPWSELLALARAADVPFFCDATQWIGRMAAKGLGECDYVTGSAHKFGGPRGVGFLKCPAQGRFHPLITGGEQQEGRRAGTENVAGVLSMFAALEHCEELISKSSEPNYARNFERTIEGRLPGVQIVGAASRSRLWNTVSALMPEADCQQRWVVKLDKLGFAVSTGSACASGKEKPSHVLTAMGYSSSQASRALRFSSGWETTEEDWESLADALEKVHRTMQRTER